MRQLEIFFFRYFSYSTLNVKKDSWVRWLTLNILVAPMLLGVIFDSLGMVLLGILLELIFATLLVFFALVWIAVYVYHNWRIRHE